MSELSNNSNGEQINGGNEDVTASDLVSKKLMKVGSGVPIGGGQIGGEQVGSGGFPVDAYEFKVPFDFMDEGEEAQLEWEISDDGTVFQLNYFDLVGETEYNLLAEPL